MTDTQKSIQTVFDLTPRDWSSMESWGISELLEWVSEIIPNSDYMWKQGYGSDTVEDAREAGFDHKRRNPSHTFFMIDDDPDIVHWIAFDKKYIPIFKRMEKFMPTGTFLEDFSLHDLVWEGE